MMKKSYKFKKINKRQEKNVKYSLMQYKNLKNFSKINNSNSNRKTLIEVRLFGLVPCPVEGNITCQCYSWKDHVIE